MFDGIGKDFGELMKRATAFKRQGNWEDALRCCREAHVMAMSSPNGGLSEEAWTKYPLYLQQAGRYDEAMRVFRQVVDASDAIIARDLGDQPAFIQRGYAHNLRLIVFDKMRVAAKREKRHDDAEEFRRQACAAEEAFEAFCKVRDLHRAREREKYEKKRAARSS